MIDLAGVKKGDLLYDLGSGDGRIAIAAANKGAKAIGFEIDGDLVKASRDNIRRAGVQHLVEIRQQDILTVDVSRGIGGHAVPFAGCEFEAQTQTFATT